MSERWQSVKIAVAERWSRRRWALQIIRAAGPIPVAVALAVFTLAAATPALLALSIGFAIARVADGIAAPTDIGAATWPMVTVATVLVVSIALERVQVPVRSWLAARVDISLRSELRSTLFDASSLAPLYDPAAMTSAQMITNGIGGWTPGAAASVQFWAMLKSIGGLATALIVASFSPLLAIWIVAVVLVQREMIRRQSLGYVKVLTDAAPKGLESLYWMSFASGPAAAKDVRLYGLDEWAVAKQVDAAESTRRPSWDFIAHVIRRQGAVFAVGVATAAASFWLVVDALGDGRLSVGAAGAVFAAITGLWSFAIVGPELLVAEAIGPLRTAMTDLASHRERSDREDERHRPGSLPDDLTLRFDDVSFSYAGNDEPVLHGLDLEIAAGSSLAIVGLNGAGKSTIIGLMTGMYQPTTGVITVGGRDLSELDPTWWWGQLSVVFQEVPRFHTRIREYIVFGQDDLDVDDAALQLAVGTAGLSEVVERAPRRWDSRLSREYDGGIEPSGGQWQRLSVARALYGIDTGRSVLVLDEPAAHLDVAAEASLVGDLFAESGGKTTVLVSHRLASVRRADSIVLIENGAASEQGTHDELMQLDGAYARLFREQASRFTTELIQEHR